MRGDVAAQPDPAVADSGIASALRRDQIWAALLACGDRHKDRLARPQRGDSNYQSVQGRRVAARRGASDSNTAHAAPHFRLGSRR